MKSGPRQAFIDYEPMTRRLTHELTPGMIVRPRAPDGTKIDQKRWTVERVGGAMTRARTGGGKHFTSQYWATDTLIPVKFKGRAATTSERMTKSAESRPRSTAPADDIAEQLRGCADLDALLAIAAGLGYPDCDSIRAKVSHLNPGLQRMNVGNRLRAWLKKTSA